MENKVNFRLFLLALTVAIAFLIPFEWYAKNVEGWPGSHDLESLDLWAEYRGTLDDKSSDDVVILGSSRGHFDINIHLWDSLTGTKPIQLAFPGSSPYHTIEDIVENSTFNGLMIISVAPGLFYTMEGSWGANRGKTLVDYYYDRTYAQRFSGAIYKYIDPLLSYTEDELTLTSLIERIPLQNRDSVDGPTLWPPMVKMDKYRNIRMLPGMETDSVIIKRQTDIWFNPDPKNKFADSVDVVLGHYIDLTKKFKAKGGRVAFIRPPVTGYYYEMEPRLFPREKYWDRLIEECDCPGYHFQDHPETIGMIPPEWSHLNRRDSDIYTRIIVDLLKEDDLL